VRLKHCLVGIRPTLKQHIKHNKESDDVATKQDGERFARKRSSALRILGVLLLSTFLLASAQAQTYSQIHNFGGGEMARNPMRA
jgi:hypothetical protein